MKRLRIKCTGHRPVHPCLGIVGGLAALTMVALPMAAEAKARPAPARPATAAPTRPAPQLSVADFYAARRNLPLWLGKDSGDAAQQLFLTLANARADGLNPGDYRLAEIEASLRAAAAGNADAKLRADRLLSDAFVAYAAALRSDPGEGVIYVDKELTPRAPSAFTLLAAAASAPSLSDYVREMGWMNPMYGQLRRALLNHAYNGEHERQVLQVNLKRARALPAARMRYILVNAAQQRLYTFADGKQVDTMRVVVGKPKYPTPMMAAFVRFAALNPYWYVPPDLASERIAPLVVRRGLGYLDELGHEVMSDWSDNAQVIDPKTIDWKAVADGKAEVLIRQKPGPHNSMGRMKFMFPNEAGVYLHDNPERSLFSEASRFYSGGCVRLEDAARLGEWLFGHKLDPDSAGTEERVPLPVAVPVYITYLTAMPDGSGVAFFDDVYGRDSARLAANGDQSAPATVAR